jgi:hypothetical protein
MADETNDPFNMQTVSSSQIAAVGFNPATAQGRVEFLKNGAVYEYDGCTQEEFDSIVSAPSVGQEFASQWKGTKPYRRIS